MNVCLATNCRENGPRMCPARLPARYPLPLHFQLSLLCATGGMHLHHKGSLQRQLCPVAAGLHKTQHRPPAQAFPKTMCQAPSLSTCLSSTVWNSTIALRSMPMARSSQPLKGNCMKGCSVPTALPLHLRTMLLPMLQLLPCAVQVLVGLQSSHHWFWHGSDSSMWLSSI